MSKVTTEPLNLGLSVLGYLMATTCPPESGRVIAFSALQLGFSVCIYIYMYIIYIYIYSAWKVAITDRCNRFQMCLYF